GIPHGKERARLRDGAVAGEEFLREALQDGPLRRARVLRLVDVAAVDAGIALVERPGRVGALEQGQRSLDEIVEIERPARSLHRLDAREDRLREGEQSLRPVQRAGALHPLVEGGKAIALSEETLGEIGRDGFRREAAVRNRRALLREEEGAVMR